MAAAVSSARPSLSFQPRASSTNASTPAAQATAPVLEFRCTYTREGYKKAPKFHDGFITYHTFNKVIVLYDDTRRVVTNHHYRDDEDVAEGLRLTFDRSILVDVAEPAGQTQTDLNQVLIQRSSPDRRPTPAARLPRVAAASQGRPRSLRDVLGASQGPIGRARLPSQTPFEQRQEEIGSHPEQPPPKRLKTATGKENVYSVQSALGCTVTGANTMKTGEIRHSWAPGSTQAVVGRVEEVHELSSDEDVQTARQRPTTGPATFRKPQQTLSSRSPSSNVHTAECRARERGKAPEKEQEHEPRPVTKPTKPPVLNKQPRPANLSADGVRKGGSPTTGPSSRSQSSTDKQASVLRQSLRSAPRVYTPTPGTSQLQLSKEKPRRMLMYRVLLSDLNSDVSNVLHRTGSQHGSSQPRSFNGTLAPQNQRMSEALAMSTEQANGINEVEARTSDNEMNVSAADTSLSLPGKEGTTKAPIDIDSSPPSEPHQASASPSPSPHLDDGSDDDLEVQKLDFKWPAEPGDSSENPISLSPRPSSPKRSSGQAPDDDDDHQPPAPFRSPAKTPSQQRMPPPPRPVLSSNIALGGQSPLRTRTPKRTFRRVLSENDAFSATPDDNDSQLESFPSLLPDADFPPTAAILRPHLSSSRQQARRSPNKRVADMAPPPGPLRRTLSDPMLIDPNVATTARITSFNVEPPIAEPSGAGETGGWTFHEAWLLFDSSTWPAEKVSIIPDWARKVQNNPTMGSAVGTEMGYGLSGASGFSSARGLLYENNAQGTGRLRDEVGAI